LSPDRFPGAPSYFATPVGGLYKLVYSIAFFLLNTHCTYLSVSVFFTSTFVVNKRIIYVTRKSLQRNGGGTNDYKMCAKH